MAEKAKNAVQYGGYGPDENFSADSRKAYDFS